jgi:hypothetical protein
MIKRLLTAMALSAFLATPAFAGSCPIMVKEIDQALASSPSVSAEKIAEARGLRDKGEALHEAGQHGESVKTLQKAKKILGLD